MSHSNTTFDFAIPRPPTYTFRDDVFHREVKYKFIDDLNALSRMSDVEAVTELYGEALYDDFINSPFLIVNKLDFEFITEKNTRRLLMFEKVELLFKIVHKMKAADYPKNPRMIMMMLRLFYRYYRGMIIYRKENPNFSPKERDIINQTKKASNTLKKIRNAYMDDLNQKKTN
jgi:hypothetical protein